MLLNNYLKNLNRIEFVVTDACTGNCKHCSQGEHKGTEKLDKRISADAVCKIAENYKINSVMTFGGEPLLCPDTVCEIHNAARKMNIPERQLITNGYFSKKFDEIKRTADKIIESGVNEILLSVDAFHQETIPVEYVMFFAECVIYHDVNLKVHPAWLVSSDVNNAYNNKTREILDCFNRIGIETGEGNVVFPSGNALKFLGEYLEPKRNNENPYWNNPEDIRALSISANGDVLGDNIYKHDIINILKMYKPIKKTNL